MEQLTLEQTAEKYGELNGTFGTMQSLSTAFEAGAEWQKEQFKQLFIMAKNAANVCEENGAIDSATWLRNEIERLESE